MTNNKSLLHAPVYPFLIALVPVISLYAVNRVELSAFDVVRPTVVCLFITLVTVAVSRAVSNSSRSAAVLGCFLLVSMFAYGYVFRSTSLAFEIEILHNYFLPVWLILTGGVWAMLARTLRRKHSSLHNVTKIFNIVGITLIAAASAPLMLGSSPSQSTPQNSNVKKESNDALVSEWLSSVVDINQINNKFPDVYYIVLDGYARGDVLKSRFGFDNSDFLDWLEAKGFFVGRLSHSNYAWTHLSLPATLNLEYLQTLLPENLGSFAPNNEKIERTIQEKRIRYQNLSGALSQKYIKKSRIQSFFSSLGYRIIKAKTGYAVSRLYPASLSDAILGPMNDFEEMLIGNSIIEPFILTFRNSVEGKVLQITKHDRIVKMLDELGDVVNENGPKFVFYHINSPHSHFCFDENGGMVQRHPVYDFSPWMSDRRAIPGYIAWSRENYPRNVAGLNIHVTRSIQRILDESGGDAIVIVQSDHGSPYGVDSLSKTQTDVVERFGILNAIFLPDKFPRADLDKKISSVNTFRLILRNVFNVNLPLLENRAYYSNGLLDFEDITHRLQD